MSTVTQTEKEEHLIGLVQARPPLYDKAAKGYKDKGIKESKWVEIGVELDMTGKECQQLWTKLRTQFMAFLRKLQNPSGTGAGNRPYFRHEGCMMFIKDTVDPKEKTVSNLEEISLNAINVDSTPASVTVDDNDFLSQLPLDPISAPSIPQVRATSSNKKRKLDAFDSEMLHLLKGEEDEFGAFAKMLIPKLRQINELDRKTYLQLTLKINQEITDAEVNLLLAA